MRMKANIAYMLSLMMLLTLTNCAFDVIHVKQIPTTFSPECQDSWTLANDVKLSIGAGYKRLLEKGTRWDCVGKINQGYVYKTTDQVLTIEASNVYEAYIVISDGFINGFYLPVERTYSPISSPKKMAKSIVNKPQL